MKILVLGGYGTFGGRLVELLVTDTRLTLVIAGRSLKKANEFIQSLASGAQKIALEFDRNGDVLAQLRACSPDLVIDATGPFQLYSSNPYVLVKACLVLAINYLDLSDASDFVNGISQFDQQAKAATIFMLSGISSCPVLTAAVVRHLSKDLVKIKSITGGITPSPHARVGLNVIKAITSYAGKPVKLRRHGRAEMGFGIIDSCRYRINSHHVKPLPPIHFSLVDVPDLEALPELWPEVENVWMGAGPTPEILHRMLNAFAWLVRWKLLPSLVPFAGLFHWVLNHVHWGEHRGGMFVQVEGINENAETVQRSWHLIAEGEDGPYIPVMGLLAIIYRCLDGNIPAYGARAGTRDLEIHDYDPLFNVRNITTSIFNH